MTWKGIKPIVHLVETNYEKGVKVLSQELKHYQPRRQQSSILPKWDITIILRCLPLLLVLDLVLSLTEDEGGGLSRKCVTTYDTLLESLL